MLDQVAPLPHPGAFLAGLSGPAYAEHPALDTPRTGGSLPSGYLYFDNSALPGEIISTFQGEEYYEGEGPTHLVWHRALTFLFRTSFFSPGSRQLPLNSAPSLSFFPRDPLPLPLFLLTRPTLLFLPQSPFLLLLSLQSMQALFPSLGH